MPREQINYGQSYVDYGPDDDGSTPAAVMTAEHKQGTPIYARRGVAGCSSEPTVHVGWHASPDDGGGWVQIHMEADPQYFRFVADHPDGAPLTSDSERTNAYSPVLTRDEINKLIKVLRRARDQAYGCDE